MNILTATHIRMFSRKTFNTPSTLVTMFVNICLNNSYQTDMSVTLLFNCSIFKVILCNDEQNSSQPNTNYSMIASSMCRWNW